MKKKTKTSSKSIVTFIEVAMRASLLSSLGRVKTINRGHLNFQIGNLKIQRAKGIWQALSIANEICVLIDKYSK